MQLRPQVPLDPAFQAFPEFNIDFQNLESLRFLVWSDAWRSFFEPMLQNLEAQLVNELLVPTQERKERRPDDFIRGSIYVIRNILNFPSQALQEADAQAEEENKIAREQRELYARAAHGFQNPLGPTPTGGM